MLLSILFTYPELACRARQGLRVLPELRVMQGNGAGPRVCTAPRKRLVVREGRQPLAIAGEGVMVIPCWGKGWGTDYISDGKEEFDILRNTLIHPLAEK